MNTTQPQTHWVHTGIEGPHQFGIRGFNELETGRGVAYTAELIHPELGVVGRIANEGRGGPTTFSPYDYARFSDRDLEEFLGQSRQDGEPMDTGPVGKETLLDEIINEAETASIVATMRRDGQFVVRSYLPREAASYGPHRGAPLVYPQIVLRRAAREHLADELARMPQHRLDDGASWQMFDGAEWKPLLGEAPLTAEQTAARLQRVADLVATAHSKGAFANGVPFDDQFHLFGTPVAGGFTLVGDASRLLKTHSWCRCARRQATVRFERWNSTRVLESGTVHAAKRCRRVVRID
ncbi:hypothetical protein MOQ72_27155 [Saccharopolyspora sp. K220]|uniref:hypothetical protein n=1 Tax=Saccharopolyspora soli TaxID=2926618 RepID=UPI001F595796|nr:hypothetical protein [Saccharopolyspora soli]MCI2421127.1 hypothetical protein [Saccharopolyspora soli]